MQTAAVYTWQTPDYLYCQQGNYYGEVLGVDPQASPVTKAVGAVFAGGLAYYIYSEYGFSFAPYLPWSEQGALNDGEIAAADREAKERARRQRQQREKMMPKSELGPDEQIKWAWTHPGIYVTGSNEYGLADPRSPSALTGITCAVPGLEGKLFRSAAFSKTHAAAVDRDGCVYQWGTGFAGNKSHLPVCTLKDPAICEVATSENFVIVRDRKSRIRLLSGTNGINNAESPTNLKFEPALGWRESVVSLAAGRSHIAVTTSSGNVYTAALDARGNTRYQLGHGSSSGVKPLVLQRVQSNQHFVSAACGADHTLLLTAKGDVLGCGANDFGQLATGEYRVNTTTVCELSMLPKLWNNGPFRPQDTRAVTIAAGAATSYAQVAQGSNLKLLAWGRGIDGQLGNRTFAHMQGTPVSISAFSDREELDASRKRRAIGIRTLAAGAEHVVAVCDNSTNVVPDKSGAAVNTLPLFGYDVLVWGNNSAGQCIPERRHRFSEPEHPPLLYTSSSKRTDAVSRLQAAPSQWVPTAIMQSANVGKLPKKLLVEQAFAAGVQVTASYLRPL
ncbi:hypothetical protein IWW36_003021 [Coemansia brasiliensis]|uniref:Uncharacterized protein n=1 Tax=Coemansia brasiliensis TaxID=2650707 RepID=A0A9W8IDM1_9FUNG|nr:hypothetical protein IWW36_003021 [Coemansia brasiliensis]